MEAFSRTTTLTGFRSPALTRASTSSVWVAEKRPYKAKKNFSFNNFYSWPPQQNPARWQTKRSLTNFKLTVLLCFGRKPKMVLILETKTIENNSIYNFRSERLSRNKNMTGSTSACSITLKYKFIHCEDSVTYEFEILPIDTFGQLPLYGTYLLIAHWQVWGYFCTYLTSNPMSSNLSASSKTKTSC